jgi:hypothetical protein
MTVQLRPMRDDEFAAWLPRARRGYADDMIRNGGVSVERATAKAAADTEALFPGDRPSALQSVFVIEADGEPVGELWVAERDQPEFRYLWVYLRPRRGRTSRSRLRQGRHGSRRG